jgi:hypothetical protein
MAFRACVTAMPLCQVSGRRIGSIVEAKGLRMTIYDSPCQGNELQLDLGY